MVMKKDMRSFTLVDVRNVDGCATKFKVRGSTGRFLSRTPVSAALKAFNGLCAKKNIKGQCAFLITVRETTEGSAKKEFTYHCTQKKVAEPNEFQKKHNITHMAHAKSRKNMKTSCASGKTKSSGPMRRTRRSRK